MRGQGPCRQPVELTRGNVPFDLPIPLVCIIGREPFPKLGQLLGRQLLDLALERFHLAYEQMISSARSGSLPMASAPPPWPTFGSCSILDNRSKPQRVSNMWIEARRRFLWNLLRGAVSLALLAAVLLVSAGRWDLPFFWAYVGVNFALMAALAAGVGPRYVLASFIRTGEAPRRSRTGRPAPL
jgi:hypothetical protein